MNNVSDVNNVSEKMISPPTPLDSERVQLGLLIIMLFFGAPINLAALTRLLKQRSLGRNGRLNLLKLHLNTADLLILFVHVTAQICWQITYEFRGGEILCKVIKFISSTAFQASSNLIVSVAMDRLFTVLNGNHWYKKRFKRRTVWYVRFCLVVAWSSAVILNVPQLYVWRIYAPYPNTRPNWKQCTTIYAQHAHTEMIAKSYNETVPIWKPAISQLTYDLTHVLVVFWIPAMLIITSYSLVLFFLYRLETRRRRALTVGRRSFEKDFSEYGIDNPAAVPLQDTLGSRRHTHESMDSAGRRFSLNKEIVLSVGNPTGDARKESQSTTASSNVYLVPVEISRVRNNTFRISFMLITAYLIFWGPYNGLALWQFVDEDSYKVHANKIKFLNGLIVLNSVLNPFLYGAVKVKKRKYH